MGVELVRKYVSIAITSYYRSALRHPLLVFMVFVLFWIYRSFPLMFSVLAHASPVIASTLVLLGTLLYYGHASVTENQIQGKPYYHHHEHFNLVNSINFDSHHEIGKLREEDRSDVVLVNRDGQFGPLITKDVELKRDSRLRNAVDVLHNAQSQGQIDVDDKGWDTGSDLVESSSPSASVADTFPMLDELHTLFESKVPKQTHMSNIATEYVSDPSPESGWMVNETNDFDYDDYDDDQEDMEVIDDEDEDTLIMWTEDDQRNLMNLGTSELERNHCLENLIARQKALKNTRMMVEKNMVNISPDPAFSATHISTARMNSFDLPCGSNQNNLEPVPSAMLPKSNPFDLSNEPSDKHDRPGPIFHSNFVAVQPNDPFSHPHESFDVGPSTLGQFVRDGTNSFMNRTNIESTGLTHGEINPSGQPDLTFVKEDICSSDISEEKLRGVNETGYQDITRSSSSSSSFCDVTDDMYGGQDDEEEEFKSIEIPSTEDSKDLQMEESFVDDSAAEETEQERLHQRLSRVQHGLTSWLSGWKA